MPVVDKLRESYENPLSPGAAHGDKDRYLGILADDAVFLDTDGWEHPM